GCATTVEQHQRRAVAQSTQVRARKTGLEPRPRADERDVGPPNQVRGHVAHDLGRGDRATLRDLLSRYYLQWQRSFDVGAPDIGAGDFDLVELADLGVLLSVRGQRDSQQQSAAPKQSRACLGCYLLHAEAL